ncbi:NAD(P)-binding domain-containing protein [Paenibacillus sp. LS1]|uniref:NAD(P)-binding domain-containing protein n=1 Tax=Paenibacillus sp. LS1 TaxID=2992120 RepID=UPI00222F92A6|nr:NAD(P)-binding domain-containing protein [Paenibacillus sp. LS1]MCW3794436.1 NAD(P)-binding domain-containing protein [Paenibacillus sp. LS1]
MERSSLPVAIIGGGPIGLAAAAHLVEAGESFILFEKGEHIGTHFEEYGHVRLFSPWMYNMDPAINRLLGSSTEWNEPKNNLLPYARDLVEQYLAPFSHLPQIKPHIYVKAEVQSVSRKRMDKLKSTTRNEQPFVLHIQIQEGMRIFEAKAVIDASGVWHNPNPLVSSGIWTNNEREAASSIFYTIPDVLGKDQSSFENKHVVVVGSGHSAINSLIQLNSLRKRKPELAPSQITWLNRKATAEEAYAKINHGFLARYRLGEQLQELLNNSILQIWNPYDIEHINQDHDGQLTITGTINNEKKEIGQIDIVIANTGNRPDLHLFRELRYDLDPSMECTRSLAATIAAKKGVVAAHGERELRHPEENFYIIGAKSFGRSPSFFLINGYEQARSVVASITGNQADADRVVISFPEEWMTPS